MKRTVDKFKVLGFIAIIFSSILLFGFKENLPKVFVIGDSISMHYGPYLEKSLSGFFTYDRKKGNDTSLDNPNGANGGDSNMVVSYLKELKENPHFKTDYLLINCGLHDIKRNTENSEPQVSLEQYSKNLYEIVSISKELDAKLIWINSTPVVDSVHNSKVNFKRYNEDLIKYNLISNEIMTKMKIQIIDIYTFTIKFIPDRYIDHVHYNNEVRQKQADFIAGNLVKIVNEY
jgi:hypothetical protein